MSSKWQWSTLGDLTINYDGKRKPVKESERNKGPYPYYGASGIVDYVDGYLFDGEYLLIAEDGENLRSRQTPIAFMATDKFWVNNHAHIVTGNELADTRFLMYALLHADINSFLTGAVMPKLTQGNLNKIPIHCPPLEMQRLIACHLGAFDERINLLRETNATLESIAQALFKSWFIDFDPVHAKAEGREPEGMDTETAALFPDSFEESEWGLVPMGWSIGKLGNILYARGGYAYKSNAFCESGFPVVKIKNIVGDGTVDLQNTVYIDKDLADKTSKFMLQDGDIVIAMTGATIGKTGIIVTGNCQAPYLNQRVAKFESKLKNHCWFTYVALQTESIFTQVVDIASGSAQANISTSGIESIRLILPCHNQLIEFFNEAVEPLFLRWIGNQKQINTLTKLRDTLLPRLISGQLMPNNVREIL